MTDRSLQAEMLARVVEDPARRCLAFYRADGSARWLSREQLHRRAAAAAGYLHQQGLGRGDVCVIVLANGESVVIALLASLFLGAVPLLVAPPTLLRANLELFGTLRRTLRRTRARVAVCTSSLELDLPRLRRDARATRFVVVPDTAWPEELEAQTPTLVLPGSEDVAAMQLTSGTTSVPRICVWDHRAVLAALDGMAEAMALGAGDVCLNWTPLYHDMGLVNNFLLCMSRGTPLVLLSPQDFIKRPALWLRALSEMEATITWSPNFGFAVTARRVLDGEIEGVRLDRVHSFWNAAERIHAETLDAFHARFEAFGVSRRALKTNYGCAENIGGATFSDGDAARRETIARDTMGAAGVARQTHVEGVPAVSIVGAGRPYPGLAVRIVSPRGRILQDGHVGEICLDTPSRMRRYHRDERETRRAFRGALLHTGDLGYLREGELFWVGRLRERITIRGKKFDPSAFEAVLASTPGVREGCFAAFGVPSADVGTERVVLVSEVRELEPGDASSLTAAIRKNCFLHLGLVPDDVILVRSGTLAKTSSGKRRHRSFRKQYLEDGLASVRMA